MGGDTLRKAFLAGVGAMLLTRERAEELVNKLVKKGELSEEEQPKVIKELRTKVEESKKEWEKKICETVEKTLEKMNIPTKSQLDELKAKLDQLSQKIERTE